MTWDVKIPFSQPHPSTQSGNDVLHYMYYVGTPTMERVHIIPHWEKNVIFQMPYLEDLLIPSKKIIPHTVFLISLSRFLSFNSALNSPPSCWWFLVRDSCHGDLSILGLPKETSGKAQKGLVDFVLPWWSLPEHKRKPMEFLKVKINGPLHKWNRLWQPIYTVPRVLATLLGVLSCCKWEVISTVLCRKMKCLNMNIMVAKTLFGQIYTS